MTKGIDTQILRQQFCARAGNWYKWLQISCEAERVLTMWQRDLRDSCTGFLHHCCWQKEWTWSGSASAPAAEHQHHHHPFTALLPSSISLDWGVPLPLMPKCCCRRAALRCGLGPKKPQRVLLPWDHISELTVWLPTADGPTLVGYLVLSEGQIYFQSLCLSFLPAEAARQSVYLWYFFFQVQLCCSEVCHQKQWDFWHVCTGNAGRRVKGISAFHCKLLEFIQAWIEFPNLSHSLCALTAGWPAKDCRTP